MLSLILGGQVPQFAMSASTSQHKKANELIAVALVILVLLAMYAIFKPQMVAMITYVMNAANSVITG